jgi:hypothetical protein
MSDGPLLVPMHVDAMVLNVEASGATSFLRFQPDYSQLPLFQPVETPFAGGSTTPPPPGIYLHWTLPRPLRHGRHDTDAGATTFPWVPNRWVVVRIQQSPASGGAVKAWIVESDYMAEDGSSPFVSPEGLDAQGLPQPTRIGRSLLLTPTLTELSTTEAPFLTAVGPGTASFTTYAPGVTDVFAFYDQVYEDDEETAIENGTFTYHVAGWYSNPSWDPLAGARWAPSSDTPGASVDDTLGFLAYLGGAAPPTSMLVHALVSGVPWQRGADNPPAPSYPVDVPTTVKVAIGNTALDALAAIVRLDRDSQTEANLLEAFGYGLLDRFDRPGSAAELDMAIREHWFGASPGGSAWTVVPAEPPGSTALPTPPVPALTSAQQQALAALNVAQREHDREARLLTSMRWNLYALWWKYHWLKRNGAFMAPIDYAGWLEHQLSYQTGIATPPNDPGGWYFQEVTAQQAQVAAAESEVAATRALLLGLLDPNAQTLKQASLPQYHAPNDPVLLVTGLGRSTNLDPVGDLTCRLVSQTVDALTVDGTAYCAAGTCHQPVQVPALDDPNDLLPDGVQALHTESFFLSPALFAADALGDPARSADVEAAISALPPASATASSFPPVSGCAVVWEQPWVPLLLDWQVTVLKAPAWVPGDSGDPVYAFDAANWSFDGTDYVWIGPTAASGVNFSETDAGQMTLVGRTFVTPQLSFALADRLDDWVQKHKLRNPELETLLEDLDTTLDSMRSQDVLSQRLSGLRSLLVQRDDGATPPPSGAVLPALGTEPQRGFPAPYPDKVCPPVWDFAPLCGTFFVVNLLTVIDFMGRTVDLMLANWSSDPMTETSVAEYYFFPIAAPGLKAPTTQDPAPGQGESTDPTQRMLALPPRFVQDAQLALRLTSNDGHDVEIDLEAGANPVCGWIVPNHLDRSLAMYAPDGTAWGELFLSLHVGDTLVPQWQPDPTNPGAPASVSAIPNDYVSAMLAPLAAPTGAVALADLLDAIDLAQWTIDPGGRGEDEDLSVLVGRPLAIVRAEASLRLRGLAPWSQDWWTTFAVDAGHLPDRGQPAPLAAVDGGVGAFEWPVRLGDQTSRGDGLVGYFADDAADPAATWSTFNAVAVPPDATSGYLCQIGADGDYVMLRAIDDTVTAPDPAQAQIARLTMLVDPRGAVHAFSGLLPVATVELPRAFAVGPLAAMSYVFRSGPLLSPVDQVRLPRPTVRTGTWTWFDHVLGTAVPIVPTDDQVSLASVPPLVREGWLKLSPNPPLPPKEPER